MFPVKPHPSGFRKSCLIRRIFIYCSRQVANYNNQFGGIMHKQNIAIIGLGRIGSAFLGAMLQKKQSINLACVAERMDTPAKSQAASAGIGVVSLDEIVAMGNAIDIIFDLTGIPDVRRELREKLLASNNSHTIIASETIVRLIWSLVSDADLPEIAGRKTGY